MTQTIFYPGLNVFCQKYLIANVPITPSDQSLFSSRIKEQQAFLFEELLLFDQLSIKVHGENISMSLMYNFFGEKGLEALLEQDAIRFVLWTPMIVYLNENQPGIDCIASGNLSSPAHSDPEQSVELGLNWLKNSLSKRQRKRLVRKAVEKYTITDASLAKNSVSVVKSAFQSGKLEHYGLTPDQASLDRLSLDQKKTMIKCAQDLLEYEYLVKEGMTSYSDYKYYSPFLSTAHKFSKIARIQDGFRQIADIEGFPNLQAVMASIDNSLSKIARLRQTRAAKKFRIWLERTEANSLESGFTKSYIDSIAERKGLFDSAPAKFMKAATLTVLGAGAGAAALGTPGAVVGAATGGILSAELLEIGSHFGLDLLDSFILENISKGWSPRMFFNQIRKL